MDDLHRTEINKRISSVFSLAWMNYVVIKGEKSVYTISDILETLQRKYTNPVDRTVCLRLKKKKKIVSVLENKLFVYSSIIKENLKFLSERNLCLRDSQYKF